MVSKGKGVCVCVCVCVHAWKQGFSVRDEALQWGCSRAGRGTQVE